ncbi:MAG: response regulator [Chloroflexi bacterium]|nr:response regulator [Chloroflexota bacterium]
MERQPRVLIVDDNRLNVRILEALLKPRGYLTVSAGSGEAALEQVGQVQPDLILLDIVMPGIDGHEVCRRLREDPASRFLPVVMITASGEEEKLESIEAGADDFITKPFNQAELLARVKSLLRVKDYHDTIEAQKAELAEWNRTLEERVQQQVGELERLGRLRRFLSPQLADVVVSSGASTLLESHRRQIAVVFCDLRGFTSFVDSTEAEEVIGVLRQYHQELGAIIFRFEGTLEHFAGDGIMVFFNDPIECPDPAARAVRMAMAMRQRVIELTAGWRTRGYTLGFGVGIALGPATLGMIGFEGRRDYSAVGSVVNMASRLCSEARHGQILIEEHMYAAVEGLLEAEPVGGLSLKGFARPVPAFNVLGLKDAAPSSV